MQIYRRMNVALLAALLLMPAAAMAQDNGPGPQNGADEEAGDQQTGDQQDPPSRVGRLGYFEGQVSQFGQDQDDWTPAQLNFPVTGNTAFATGTNGRAEFELGSAVARIGNGTELDVVALDDENTDLRLPQGSAQLRLPNPSGGTAIANLVTTPRGDVTLSAPGRYVIAAGTEDQPTIVTVYQGQAQIVDAAGATFNIAAGQAGVLTGNTDQPTFNARAAEPDPLDSWAQQRERQYVAAAPLPPQVSPAMTGVSVLSAYGGWQTDPQYGPVWYPRGMSANWEPYREGHWSYVRPWGWTWIDNAPWGFAPFHYGRWVRVRNAWAWAPGAVTAQPGVVAAHPVYAPALVVFAAIAAAASGPGVAWYPLGWNEPYIPARRVSRAYIERINVHVVDQPRLVQVNDLYNRLYVRGGNADPYTQLRVGVYRDRAVAVPRATFTGARPVAQTVFKPAAGQPLRPIIRPAAVQAPPAKPQPALRAAEPPKAAILPAAKRAAIPQKLMAPKAAKPTPVPAAATIRPPVQPNAVKPGAKPAVIAPPKPPENHPAIAKPEAKPSVVTPGQRPEAKPPLAPSTRHPEAKPAVRPGTHPAAQPAVVAPPQRQGTPPTVKPEGKPVPRPTVTPQARPAVTPPAARPPIQPAVKPTAQPPVMHPAAKAPAQPIAKPAHEPAKPPARQTPRNEARPAAGTPPHHDSGKPERREPPRPGDKPQQ